MSRQQATGPVTDLPPAEPMSISLRAYAEAVEAPAPRHGGSTPPRRPSHWTVVFDTETTTDAAQRLRFGAYQVREGERLHKAGLFHELGALEQAELGLLKEWARDRELVVRTREEFVEEVLLVYGYDLRGSVVGFNLPFDLSRVAVGHGSARGPMKCGFSLRLSPNTRRPAVQVKHLNTRAALIRFTHPAKQLTPRGERRRKLRVPPHRGFFLDVKTLAAALTSRSHSLASLSKFLGVDAQKSDRYDHGGPLTHDYLDYATRDVQATWECCAELLRRYEAYRLTGTPAHAIKSEASLGKASLLEMGIRPWREVQPDFPAEMLGRIMASYYGGRSEVRVRREVVRVLYCDFLSMYPTVCTLMGLWRFVISEGMTWRDSTHEVRGLLEGTDASTVLDRSLWPRLAVLVRVAPEGDIFPVRAAYGGGSTNTIGLNHLTSYKPMWFTLADCFASKLLTGRAPRVLEAVAFEPGPVQKGLRNLAISGSRTLDPSREDFYRAVIERRSRVKMALDSAAEGERDALDAEQYGLKILANATSYGIFVEVNVEDREEPARLRIHAGGDAPFEARARRLERPGRYFHPLLATLITGAARLMLATAERLAADTGLGWAFCDTDSIAFGRPAGMGDVEFLQRAEGVRCRFDALNPYDVKGSILKLEDKNFRLSDGRPTRDFDELWCLAISAKRYALFNVGPDRKPAIRKASAHGLGHLRAPYENGRAPDSIPPPPARLEEIGVERWEHDLWYRIVEAALAERPDRPDVSLHPNMRLPAVGRYAATTPQLLRWFKGYNAARAYADQVRPFGFLTALHATKLPRAGVPAESDAPASTGRPPRRRTKPPRPIAPYTRDPGTAAEQAFDRESGVRVPAGLLATYREAVAQYHLHPEDKFLGAEPFDRGETRRRHVRAVAAEHIGKEADRWEEQFHLGADPGALVEYGAAPEAAPALAGRVREGLERFPRRQIAAAARMSLRDVGRAARDPAALSPRLLRRLDQAVASLAKVVNEGDDGQRFGRERRSGECLCGASGTTGDPSTPSTSPSGSGDSSRPRTGARVT